MRPSLTELLLDWYDLDARALPWRARPGEYVDPYRVWLSEIMLQQTTVAAVIPYFQKFTQQWPQVEDLAIAPLDGVLTQWAGLGYYARARNLHKCAKVISQEHGGQFPEQETELLKLPGIGPYTAAAIAAIAFNNKATVVDGNVERVMARMHNIQTPLPAAKDELRKRAAALTPDNRPGDYAQAVMDLGAIICAPRNPDCPRCPWGAQCIGLKTGGVANLPKRTPKPVKPQRHGVVFWVESDDDFVLVRTRAPKGLLGGMTEVPSTPWLDVKEQAYDPNLHAPITMSWQRLPGTVRHTFTHFHLELEIWAARVKAHKTITLPEDGSVWLWADLDQLEDYAFPSVMQKVIALAGHSTKQKRVKPSRNALAGAINQSA